MTRLFTLLLLIVTSCGVAPQPESARTIAAYEVHLPTASDRREFVGLLSREAMAHGYHVDSQTDAELNHVSDIHRQTLNASVWRGEDDDEIIASAMDFEANLGRIWLSFSKGEFPEQNQRFQQALMPKIKVRWSKTFQLPIMPSGAIPLPEDLKLTKNGYTVKPERAHIYSAQAE